jgi:hypothetical protein
VSSRQIPRHIEATRFVTHHLGKGCFAPFTGQDYPAWRAFVYLVECYANGGGLGAIEAMQFTVRCAQLHERVLRCFVQAIPAVMDWGDVRRLWPQIARDLAIYFDDGRFDLAIHLAASERCQVGRNGLGGHVVLHGVAP